jgi:3-hydroxybutyryl-CoA dehydrogenase
MMIAVLADEVLKQELLSKNLPANMQITWTDSVRSLTMMEADVYIDLLFEWDAERTSRLKQVLPKPILVNSVAWTTKTIGKEFIRINAWPTLLRRSITEVAVGGEAQKAEVSTIFTNLGWQYQVVPDVPGMITARVLAMLINEAYFTLEAEVSTREEIDTAMKLGTNYPLGPFEWSVAIGLHRVYELLKELSRTDARYQPAAMMEKEVQHLLMKK